MEHLEAIRLEYVNDYLTVDKMAEHYGLDLQEMYLLLAIAEKSTAYHTGSLLDIEDASGKVMGYAYNIVRLRQTEMQSKLTTGDNTK